MTEPFKPMTITPAMMEAIAKVPLPKFHSLWKQYASSQFRREWLTAWAGEDIEKQRAISELLAETVPQ